MEQLHSFRLVGLNITKNMAWRSHIISILVKKRAQKKLYFLRKLKKANVFHKVLVSLYRGAIKSIANM